jgi:hypothetical protein
VYLPMHGSTLRRAARPFLISTSSDDRVSKSMADLTRGLSDRESPLRMPTFDTCRLLSGSSVSTGGKQEGLLGRTHTLNCDRRADRVVNLSRWEVSDVSG